jgi:hypothetical protein
VLLMWIGTCRIGTILDRDNDKPDVSSDDSISRSTSGGEGDSGTSVLTPFTGLVSLDDEADDLWHEWNTG